MIVLYYRWKEAFRKERVIIVEAIQVTKNAYTINDATDVLFSKLDEAIDDMENGRVISEEEMWAELDAI